MTRWMEFAARRKKTLAAFLTAGVLVCLVLLFFAKFDESVNVLVPASVRERVSLFQHSPLNKKLFSVVTAQDPQTALAGAQSLRNALAEEKLISLPPVLGPSFASDLLAALPYRFTAGDEARALERLNPAVFAARMNKNYEDLLSFQGAFVKDLIAKDPFGLVELSAAKLKKFDVASGLEYTDGFLISEDGKTLVGMFDSGQDGADFDSSRRLDERFNALKEKTLPPEADAFYLGAARYTNENVRVIRRDLLWVGGLSLLGLGLIFFFFLRRRRALLVYLLPLAVLPPAAVITWLAFGHISGITLGFGSVVAGLAVDYALYAYFAVLRAKASAGQTARHLSNHLFYNFITSALCFGALWFSSIEVFRQIALFALTGLLLAWLAAVFVLPAFWASAAGTQLPAKPLPDAAAEKPRLPRVWAGTLLCFFLLFGLFGYSRLHVSGDARELNSTSKAFVEQKNAFDRLFARETRENALLFVFGEDEENALENNEALSALLGDELAVSAVMPSARSKQKNAARWQDFWSASRVNYARLLAEEESGRLGLTASAFEPFFDFIRSPLPPDSFDFTTFYNPFVQENGRSAVVNIVPNREDIRAAVRAAPEERGLNAVFISADELQKDLVQDVRQEAAGIVILSVCLSFLAVWILLKRFTHAALAFVPVLCAFAAVFGVLGAFGVPVNFFVFIFLPLLTGIGVDYGIFQLVRHRARGTDYAAAYPARALWAAGLSTLAGFGVLVFARHAVLFIIGASSFLGIAGALFGSFVILPALLGGAREKNR